MLITEGFLHGKHWKLSLIWSNENRGPILFTLSSSWNRLACLQIRQSRVRYHPYLHFASTWVGLPDWTQLTNVSFLGVASLMVATRTRDSVFRLPLQRVQEPTVVGPGVFSKIRFLDKGLWQDSSMEGRVHGHPRIGEYTTMNRATFNSVRQWLVPALYHLFELRDRKSNTQPRLQLSPGLGQPSVFVIHKCGSGCEMQIHIPFWWLLTCQKLLGDLSFSMAFSILILEDQVAR